LAENGDFLIQIYEIPLEELQMSNSNEQSSLSHIPLYHMLFELAKELRDTAVNAHSPIGTLTREEMKYSAGAIFFACSCLESWANALVGDRSLIKADGRFKWPHGQQVQQRLLSLESTIIRGQRRGWPALSLKEKWRKLTEIIDPAGRLAFTANQQPFSYFAQLVDIRNKRIAHHQAEIVTDPSTLLEVTELTADWAERACRTVVDMCDGIERYGGDPSSPTSWWHQST
jgi:hypothetical protein